MANRYGAAAPREPGAFSTATMGRKFYSVTSLFMAGHEARCDEHLYAAGQLADRSACVSRRSLLKGVEPHTLGAISNT
jgi:hypothetical protein